MPIQRVCRYPLLLAALLGAADTPTPLSERGSFLDPAADGEFDVGVDIERALGAMRGVAEEADDARRQKESEIKTATVLARLEAHQVITPTFVHSLGPCRLIGSLDVLHHHPTLAPLLPPVKVKYLAAFLYRGYLVLAKVKKGKVYEAKHFLPLEVFEMIDIAEGKSRVNVEGDRADIQAIYPTLSAYHSESTALISLRRARRRRRSGRLRSFLHEKRA